MPDSILGRGRTWRRSVRRVDFSRQEHHMDMVKTTKAVPEPKTPGTVAVEKHRPLMNKLTAAERRRLRQRAAELLAGQ
jgi:hypothetical protein